MIIATVSGLIIWKTGFLKKTTNSPDLEEQNLKKPPKDKTPQTPIDVTKKTPPEENKTSNKPEIKSKPLQEEIISPEINPDNETENPNPKKEATAESTSSNDEPPSVDTFDIDQDETPPTESPPPARKGGQNFLSKWWFGNSGAASNDNTTDMFNPQNNLWD